MLLPLLLILLSTAAAGIIAYGTHPGLTHWSRGLAMIMLTRRLEWPLILLALLGCMILLGLVISNRRKVWWLIGLAPVLALLVLRFAPWNQHRMYILDSPLFLDADAPGLPQNNDWVVGLMFEDRPYALPYKHLYRTPVVFITDYDKRMLLMWSAYANRAIGVTVTRELKARDLEIVSTPASSLLLLDRRLGQFICSVTGQTVHGAKPIGFGAPVQTTKTTWDQWYRLHPNTKVLFSLYDNEPTPGVPIAPRDIPTSTDGVPSQTTIAMIGSTPPVALEYGVRASTIRILPLGQTRAVILQDATTHRIRAFDRHVQEDLYLTVALPPHNPKHPEAFMVDNDTGSWWTLDGHAIDGPLKGTELKSIPIEDGLYWGVMKYWYPQLTLEK